MSRLVRHENAPRGRGAQAHGADARGGAPPIAKQDAARATQRDGYLSKLAKYVPAETISIATVLFAAFDPRGGAVWPWVAAGALVNVLYLYSLSRLPDDKEPSPRPYFYVLSAVAFIAWAIATINAVGAESGLSDVQRGAVLALAAFLIPAVDTVFGLRGQQS